MKLKSHLLGMFLVLFLVNTSFAQQGHSLSYKLLSPDYQYLIDNNNAVRYNGENAVITGVEIAYLKSLSSSLDIGIPLRHGTTFYPLSETNVNDYQQQAFTSLGLNARFRTNNGKILSETAFLSPFIFAGVEGNYYSRQESFEFNVPVGLGLNFRVGKGVNLQVQSEYHFGATNFLVHGGGLFFDLGRGETPEAPKVNIETPVVEKPVVKEPVKEVVVDTDGDGIEDSKDQCPSVAGKINGCPDTDGDGIIDSNDECPKVAGKINGCPDTDGDGVIDANDNCPSVAGKVNGCPDTDGDGVIDSKDACPSVAGKINGCPDTDGDGVINSKDACPNVAGSLNGCPDGDNDGIQDSKDRCPKVAGVAENNGCPVVVEEVKKVLEFAKQGVQFNTGSNVIKTSSYTVLNNVAKIMKEHPEYNLRISGYTDSQGRADRNLALSQKRAKACFQYLVNQGIAANRISHEGYGEANPVATNDTPVGRAKNRRVEFDIYFSGK